LAVACGISAGLALDVRDAGIGVLPANCRPAGTLVKATFSVEVPQQLALSCRSCLLPNESETLQRGFDEQDDHSDEHDEIGSRRRGPRSASCSGFTTYADAVWVGSEGESQSMLSWHQDRPRDNQGIEQHPSQLDTPRPPPQPGFRVVGLAGFEPATS
jgi:hypothetical protein